MKVVSIFPRVRGFRKLRRELDGPLIRVWVFLSPSQYAWGLYPLEAGKFSCFGLLNRLVQQGSEIFNFVECHVIRIMIIMGATDSIVIGSP